MAAYYIGADVHCNNTELAIEQRGRIVAVLHVDYQHMSEESTIPLPLRSTVGITEEAIKKYIQMQDKEDSGQAKLEF